MSSIIPLIISLISGLIGGNIAGTAMPEDKSLGALGNSIAGLLGGGAGSYILSALGAAGTAATSAAASGNLDISSIIAQIGSGGVGGAILMIIVGLIKGAVKK